jgi:hypothetical protein
LGGFPSCPALPINVTVCNPLLRTPLSLIIDDSCPVINKAYYWIKQRHEWRLRHRPDSRPMGWEIHYDKLERMPNTIPAAFAATWGEWCGEHGIRGKFSMVPFPAGVGRIDRGFPGFPERELVEWLRVTKEVIWRNFDITPEMLTHTRVVDLKTWQLTEQWEQEEWEDPPPAQLRQNWGQNPLFMRDCEFFQSLCFCHPRHLFESEWPVNEVWHTSLDTSFHPVLQ